MCFGGMAGGEQVLASYLQPWMVGRKGEGDGVLLLGVVRGTISSKGRRGHWLGDEGSYERRRRG